MVLPERTDMPLAVLEKLEKLVQAGATWLGPKPTRDVTLADYPHQATGAPGRTVGRWLVWARPVARGGRRRHRIRSGHQMARRSSCEQVNR
jgi:hypothetical protein